MSTQIFEPVAEKVQGNDKIIFIKTVADPAAPSLATEINAATSLEVTLAAYGTWNAPVNVNTGNSPRRIGTTVQLPQEGNAQRQVIPFPYPVNPSLPDSDDANKVKAFLAEGTEFYALVRRGTDKDTAFAADDIGLMYHLRAGYQPEATPTGDDEFAEYQIMQNLIPLTTNPVAATVVA